MEYSPVTEVLEYILLYGDMAPKSLADLKELMQ